MLATVAAGQPSLGNVPRPLQHGSCEVGSTEIGLDEVGPAEVGVGEVCSSQVGVGEVCSVEKRGGGVRFCEVGFREVGARRPS